MFSGPTIDFSQKFLLSKLDIYLSQLHAKPTVYQKDLLKKIKTGHCDAFTILVLYSLWLENQPKETTKEGKEIPRDDFTWFKKTVKKINLWNNDIVSLSKEDRADFDRLLSHLEYFQFIHQYQAHGHGDIDTNLVDTRGRVFQREYAIAGCFTDTDFVKLVELDVEDEDKDEKESNEDENNNKDNNNTYTKRFIEHLTQPNRITLITSCNHDIGILNIGNTYFFHNSNLAIGPVYFLSSEFETMVQAIFKSNEYQSNIPSPLGFRVFSCDNSSICYPDQKALLEELNIPGASQVKGYADDYTALHIGAFIGCQDSCEHFLTKNADMNAASQQFGATPISLAAMNGKSDIVKLFITNNVDLKPSNRGISPLHQAALNNHLDIVKECIAQQVDLNTFDENGYTALMRAASGNHFEMIDELIANGAQLDIKDLSTACTALHIAAYYGHVESVKRLVRKNILNAKTTKGASALTMAAEGGHFEVFKLLMDAGADPVFPVQPNNLTAFHFAAMQGHAKIVEALIQYGYNVNHICANNVSALLLAADGNHLDVLNILLKHGAMVNHKRFSDGSSALHIAAEKNHIDVVKQLLSAGADINSQNNMGTTPLMIAARHGNLEMVKLLIQQGAKINMPQNDGATALHWAVYCNKIDVVDELIRSGANINATTAQTRATPLIIAAELNHLPILHLLLAANARVDVTRSDGATALHLAAQRNFSHGVEALIKNGANPFAKTNSGRQAKTLTTDFRIAKFLESAETMHKLSFASKQSNRKNLTMYSNITKNTRQQKESRQQKRLRF